MANTQPAKYTVQLGPTVTPQFAGELAALAKHSGVSASTIARKCMEEGIVKVRRRIEREHGPVPERLLAYFIAEAEERGNRQVSRRRAYDERTRGTGGEGAGEGGATTAA